MMETESDSKPRRFSDILSVEVRLRESQPLSEEEIRDVMPYMSHLSAGATRRLEAEAALQNLQAIRQFDKSSGRVGWLSLGLNVALFVLTVVAVWIAVKSYKDADISSKQQQSTLDTSRDALQSVAANTKSEQQLLSQSVKSLEEAAELLKKEADSTRAAASYAERQYRLQSIERQEDLARRSKVPKIALSLELMLPDGAWKDIAILDEKQWAGNFDNPALVDCNGDAGIRQVFLQLYASNVGSATLRQGYFSVASGFSKDITIWSNGGGEHDFETNGISFPLQNIRPSNENNSMYKGKFAILIPKLKGVAERRVNIFCHFEGDDADRRDANIWFKVKY